MINADVAGDAWGLDSDHDGDSIDKGSHKDHGITADMAKADDDNISHVVNDLPQPSTYTTNTIDIEVALILS